MSAPITTPLDPLIEAYLTYLDKVGRKTPRTIIDVRCTLHRAIHGLERIRPNVDLWRLSLEDFLHWLEPERQLKASADHEYTDLFASDGRGSSIRCRSPSNRIVASTVEHLLPQGRIPFQRARSFANSG